VRDRWYLDLPGSDRDPRPVLADPAVTRLLGSSFADVSAKLDDPHVQACVGDLTLGDRGRLTIDSPLRRTDWPHPAWQGRGRLRGRGLRAARFANVDIELSAWSHDSVQLWLGPAVRHPQQWGRRRMRRYLDLAHLAADRLHAVLGAPRSAGDNTVDVRPCTPLSLAA
jgi:hypothetical protein